MRRLRRADPARGQLAGGVEPFPVTALVVEHEPQKGNAEANEYRDQQHYQADCHGRDPILSFGAGVQVVNPLKTQAKTKGGETEPDRSSRGNDRSAKCSHSKLLSQKQKVKV